MSYKARTGAEIAAARSAQIMAGKLMHANGECHNQRLGARERCAVVQRGRRRLLRCRAR